MLSWVNFKASHDGCIRQDITTKEGLTEDEVLVVVTAAGLCGTDEYFRFHDMVLGHEGVGIVEQVGPHVRNLQKGDRVGWGYQHGSCGQCAECISGSEVHCGKGSFYGESNLDQGAFATHAIWKESFLLQLPDDLEDYEAAPLMCAGSTVFSAFKSAGLSPDDRVGVLGIGGLGHLAIQFAAKQGCSVSAFSSHSTKQGDAVVLGASNFYTVDEIDEAAPLDILMVTTSQLELEWCTILRMMAPRGRIVLLSICSGEIDLPTVPLVQRALSIQGSAISPRHCSAEMLRFAARNDIKPLVQKFPLSVEGITNAMMLRRSGRIRYRAVFIPG